MVSLNFCCKPNLLIGSLLISIKVIFYNCNCSRALLFALLPAINDLSTDNQGKNLHKKT